MCAVVSAHTVDEELDLGAMERCSGDTGDGGNVSQWHQACRSKGGVHVLVGGGMGRAPRGVPEGQGQ